MWPTELDLKRTFDTFLCSIHACLAHTQTDRLEETVALKVKTLPLKEGIKPPKEDTSHSGSTAGLNPLIAVIQELN